jgi:hypothetical protein
VGGGVHVVSGWLGDVDVGDVRWVLGLLGNRDAGGGAVGCCWVLGLVGDEGVDVDVVDCCCWFVVMMTEIDNTRYSSISSG